MNIFLLSLSCQRVLVTLGVALFAFSMPCRTAMADTAEPLTRVEVLNSEGQPFDITRLRAQSVVIYAWGDWCRICERTTPMMLELAREHADASFVFINTDAPARRLRRVGEIPANVLETRLDPEHFGPEVMRKKRFDFAQLGLVFGVPAYYLVDSTGTIVARGNGSRYPATLARLIPVAGSALSSPASAGQ